MTSTATVARQPPGRNNTTRVPHAAHLREFNFHDGSKKLLDRRAIAFICEEKPEEFGGKNACIVAFKG